MTSKVEKFDNTARAAEIVEHFISNPGDLRDAITAALDAKDKVIDTIRDANVDYKEACRLFKEHIHSLEQKLKTAQRAALYLYNTHQDYEVVDNWVHVSLAAAREALRKIEERG